MKLGGNQLVPYFADMLGAVLPCISDKEEKIKMVGFLSFLQLHSSIDFFFVFWILDLIMYYHSVNGQVARETNEELRSFHADPVEGFDIRSILSVARRFVICYLRK